MNPPERSEDTVTPERPEDTVTPGRAASSAPPASAGAPAPPAGLVPGLIFIGLVVAVLSSLGAPLVPDLATVYGVSLATAQWTLTIAFLVSAVATPIMGRVGDGPHRREMVLGGLVVVCLGGVLAALPATFPVLLVGRALQGVGLGLTPLAIATARGALPPDRSGPAVSILSITTVAGVGLGYPLTGLIVELAGVHAAFWFGAAMSAAAVVIAFLVVPAPVNAARTTLDMVGAALLAGALGCLLLAISEGPQWGWTSLVVLSLLAAALVLGWAWVLFEGRTAHPLVQLSSLRDRGVLTADVTAVLAGVGMYLLLSLVTRYMQTPRSSGYGLGSSVLVTGLVLIPFSATSLLARRIAAGLLHHLTPARVLALSCVPALAAVLVLAFDRAGLGQLLAVMGIAGLGVGCVFAVMPGLIVASVAADQTGSAISFNQVLRLIGYATGSALSAVILAAFTPGTSAFPTDQGYTTAALLAGLLWVITGVCVLVLPGRRSSSRPTGAPQSAPAGAAARR